MLDQCINAISVGYDLRETQHFKDPKRYYSVCFTEPSNISKAIE